MAHIANLKTKIIEEFYQRHDSLDKKLMLNCEDMTSCTDLVYYPIHTFCCLFYIATDVRIQDLTSIHVLNSNMPPNYFHPLLKPLIDILAKGKPRVAKLLMLIHFKSKVPNLRWIYHIMQQCLHWVNLVMYNYTVEPLFNGYIGTSISVLTKEVSLMYSEISI